jgi:cytochrome c oxidase assembly protein subunit 15
MSKPRNIFEDVSDAKRSAPPKRGVIDAGVRGSPRAVAIWLLVLFLLVALTVVLGGLTRLTDSGLSITEWKPVTGALPPMGDTAWAEEFAKYQQSPEFRLQNSDMDMAAFKSIFWWEWSHRNLGRLIGMVWGIGFLFFLLTKRIPRGWPMRLLGVGVLGGLQGAVGWWMVSSGLTGRMVDVASYRLAIHLGLAFFILAVIANYAWQLLRGDIALMQARRNREAGLANWAMLLLVLAFAQVLLGALVAGIDAGRGFPEWPLMAGEFFPSGSFELQPLWSNFFENAALVQFNHRMLGYLVFFTTVFVWWRSRKSPVLKTRKVFNMILSMVLLQVVLGIVTVLYSAQWHIAITHQVFAIMTFTAILRGWFLARFPVTQSLR